MGYRFIRILLAQGIMLLTMLCFRNCFITEHERVCAMQQLGSSTVSHPLSFEAIVLCKACLMSLYKKCCIIYLLKSCLLFSWLVTSKIRVISRKDAISLLISFYHSVLIHVKTPQRHVRWFIILLFIRIPSLLCSNFNFSALHAVWCRVYIILKSHWFKKVRNYSYITSFMYL